MTGDEGLKVEGCYQCQKCTAGCPVAFAMDYQPHQVIQLINLGMMKRLLTSKTIWLCASCYTCSTRCPNEVNVAKVMDWLRQTALAQNVPPAEKEIVTFHKAFLQSIRSRGRIHELSMIARYKMSTGRYLDDIRLGWSMLAKGKLKLRASKVKQRKEVAKLFVKEKD